MAGTFFGGSASSLEQFVLPIPTVNTSSRTQYIGNGTTKAYLINWAYISASHVNVLVGGVIQGTNLWTFLSPTMIQLYTAPANGLLVEIRRITPQSSLVTFTNGAVLTADDLNLATLQNLYLNQEFYDLYSASLNGALVKVAGYGGPVTVTPAEMIAAVADQVLGSALVTSLNTRINDIDQNAIAILNNAIAVDNINSIIDSLVGVGGVGTIIAAETASRVAGDTALASQLTLLGAVNLAGTAFVLDINHVYVDSTTSMATRLSGLDANFASNAAAVVTEASARASGDTANASSITTLTSTVAGNTSSIATQLSTINGLSAQYTVKVDVNGRVAGFGLASGATNGVTVSDFVVIANRFSIVDPGATGGTPTVPFSVVGGVVFMQNVVITSAVIQNLAVTQAKIANLAVGNGQIALGAVDSSQMALTASTSIVNTNVAGPVNVVDPTSAPFTYTLVAHIAVSSLPIATTHIVTAIGAGRCQTPSGGLNTITQVLMNTSPVAPTSATVGSGVTQNNSASDTADHNGTFAIEKTFSVAANATADYYVWGLTAGAAGVTLTGTISNTNLKAEVIKR